MLYSQNGFFKQTIDGPDLPAITRAIKAYFSPPIGLVDPADTQASMAAGISSALCPRQYVQCGQSLTLSQGVLL